MVCKPAKHNQELVYFLFLPVRIITKSTAIGRIFGNDVAETHILFERNAQFFRFSVVNKTIEFRRRKRWLRPGHSDEP